MTGQIYQTYKGEINTDPDAPGGTLYFQFTGSEWEEDVLTAIDSDDGPPALFPDQDVPLQKCLASHEGAGVWNITAYYGPIPPLATGLTIWEVDTTGGREKRFQSMGTTFQQPSDAWLNTGGGTINFNGAIQVSKDQVEGVEITVPKMSLTAKHKYLSSTLESNYVQQLYDITGMTNKYIFVINWQGQELTFQPGELLFLGAVVTEATSLELEIDHKFEASFDRLTGGTPGPVTLNGFSEGLQKYGWDYGWISYTDGTSANAFIKVPQQYQAEQVYDRADFTILIL